MDDVLSIIHCSLETNQSSYAGYFLSWTAKQVLPTSISNTFSADRAFVSIHLPLEATSNNLLGSQVSIVNDDEEKMIKIYVANSNGIFLFHACYTGGESRYICKFKFTDRGVEKNSS